MLYFAYFAGIAAVIAGVKMRMRKSAVGVPEFKRANSVAGITLLSIASLGLVVVTEADRILHPLSRYFNSFGCLGGVIREIREYSFDSAISGIVNSISWKN